MIKTVCTFVGTATSREKATYGQFTNEVAFVINQTFVWSDKFSFMGTQPTDFSAGIDSVAKMDAIADQATSTAQQLVFAGQASGDTFDVSCTYIDQNNA